METSLLLFLQRTRNITESQLEDCINATIKKHSISRHTLLKIMIEDLIIPNLLSEGIVCQKRTGKSKQFVVMLENKIYKGPYTKNRLENVLSRTSYFLKWKTPLVVLPDLHKNKPIVFLKKGEWLVYENLAKDYKTEYTSYTENFQGGDNITYKVLERNTLVKLGDYIKSGKNINWVFSEENMYNFLLSHVHNYILSVGDRNMSNILVDVEKKELFVIDYDDDLGKSNDDELFYFNKAPSKDVKEILLKKVRVVYGKVIEELSSMEIEEPKLKKRLKESIALLKKYKSHNIGIKKDVEKKEGIEKTEKGKEKTEKGKEKESSHKSTGTLGKMKYGGPFAGTFTFSGYTPGIMKSALQKYIRRGNLDKALISAFELYRLHEVGGKSIQTNMYNRLAVISVEDIGLADISLVTLVLKSLYEDDRSPERLVNLVELLCSSKKTRIMSHLWTTYAIPQGRKLAEEKGLKINKKISSEDCEECEEFWKEGDPEEIKPYAEMFYKTLKNDNKSCIYWVKTYFDKTDKVKVVPRNRKTNPMVIIWEMIKKVSPKKYSEPIEILNTAYFKYTENRPFLMLAICIVLYKPSYTSLKSIKSIEEKIIGEKQLSKLLSGNYEFEVDDFVIDKHTIEGAKLGMKRKDFVLEGAKVENQCTIYYDELLKEIYETCSL